MHYKVTPELCEETKDKDGADVPAKFIGHVTINIPKYPVLCQIQREITTELMKLKKSEDGDKLAEALRSIEAEEIAFAKLEPMLVDVDLKHVASGLEIKEIDTLVSHPVCREIVGDLCLKLMTGFAEKN